jgi:predicted Zn-dependent protease
MSKPRPRLPQKSAPPADQGGVFRGILGLLILPFYLLYAGAHFAVRWLWHAPIAIKATAGLLALFVLLGGAFVARRLIINQAGGKVNYHWAEFGTAAMQSDVDGMRESLNGILAAKPDDIHARGRLEALRTGEADPADSQMCWLMTRIHLRNDRLPEAAREARKRLQSEPKDWLANCVLARDAMSRNDEEAAAPHLNAISNPDVSGSRPDLGLVLFAIELREKAGLDNSELRAFLLSRVMPSLHNVNLTNIKASGKVQIVYSYATSVVTVPEVNLGSTLEYWAFVSRLADQTVTEAAAEANGPVLSQIAQLQTVLAQCVARFLRAGLIARESAADMTKEVDARGESAWQGLRKAAPNDPNGYAGVASYLIKLEKYPEAEAVIADGLKATGPYPQLLRLFVLTAAKRDRPEEALTLALAVAKKNPDVPAVWQVVIEAAVSARRRDVAINACQEARKAKPDLPWADAVEGSLWLETGDPHKALQLLGKAPPDVRVSTPFIAKAYAKALTASGNDVQSPAFVRSVMSEAELKNRPDLARAAITGMAEAPPTVARAEFVVEQLDRALAKWPSDPDLQTEGQWARAEALYRSAELATPRWEAARLERAVRAYNSLSYLHPKDPRGFLRLAQLRLYGQKKPLDANDSVRVLAGLPNPSPEAREVMAATYVATGKSAEAVALLEPLADVPSVTASALTVLARAYHARGDGVRAKKTLQRASVLPMSDRERDDYKVAALAISQE